MFILQSALSPSAALSARSRSTTCSRSRTSFWLVWCFVNQPFRSQSGKLIVASDDKHTRLPQDGREEVVLGPDLGPEFVRGVNSGIDVSSQTLLSASQRRHDALERRVTDNEE